MTAGENTENQPGNQPDNQPEKKKAGQTIMGTVKRLKAIEERKENAGLENRVSQIMNQRKLCYIIYYWLQR